MWRETLGVAKIMGSVSIARDSVFFTDGSVETDLDTVNDDFLVVGGDDERDLFEKANFLTLCLVLEEEG
jgi:hypothetical protein